MLKIFKVETVDYILKFYVFDPTQFLKSTHNLFMNVQKLTTLGHVLA